MNRHPPCTRRGRAGSKKRTQPVTPLAQPSWLTPKTQTRNSIQYQSKLFLATCPPVNRPLQTQIRSSGSKYEMQPKSQRAQRASFPLDWPVQTQDDSPCTPKHNCCPASQSDPDQVPNTNQSNKGNWEKCKTAGSARERERETQKLHKEN